MIGNVILMGFSTILWIIFALVLFDGVFLGFFFWIFNLYPPYRHLLKEGVLIEDETADFWGIWRGDLYKSIILTRRYLVLKNSYLTSVKNIKRETIMAYKIKGKFGKAKKKIELCILVDNENVFLRFKTKKVDDWVRALSIIGIDETK